MKFKILITTSLLLIQAVLFAQVSDKGFPSPNAAALGKYADYPVSYFTGVPAINIPLYTLQDGAATLPISLSYHASGIKVSEVASWVGLGWVLNAGGVITRTIKGAPDEGSKNTGDGPKGYYKDSGLTKFPKLDMVSDPTSKIRKLIDNSIDKNSVDGESDIYTFNVNGMAGKFVFDENRHPIFLTQSDIKIKIDYSSGQFQKWTIITPGGIQYIFGEGWAKETNAVVGSSNPDDNAPTAWYLTKIIYPNSADTISIEYNLNNYYNYYDLSSEFTIADDSASLASTVPDGNYIQYNVGDLTPKNIYSKNINIRFLTYRNEYRKDIIGKAKALDEIQIVDRNTNKIIDEIRFNYNYFNSTKDGSLELGAIDTSDTKRLKLLSIQKGLIASPVQLAAYNFEYYEDTALPRRCSYDVDGQGYANDYGGHNNRFTPNTKTEFKTYGLTVTPPAGGQYREPRWPYTRAFTLKKITDPLGKITNFEFEPNAITKDTVGGGIRIKTITIEDPISKQKQIRRFDYSINSNRSSGIIFRKPSYWTPIYNEYHPIAANKYAGDNASDNDLYMGPYCKYSQSPLPLQDYQGYSVGYTQIKEYFSSDTANGYIVYTYQAKPKPTNSSRLQASNYSTSGNPNGKWNDVAPENLNYANINKRGKLYPFEPLQTDLYNGLLTKQEVYNQSGKLLQSTTYTYNDSYAENNWIRGFLANRLSYGGNNVYPFTYYKYSVGKINLRSKQTTIVDSITGKSVGSTINYLYESFNHLQPTRQITINTLGDTTENVIRYSFDFDNNAISGGVITEMKNQNILTPLRVEAWKNNNLTYCSSTEYTKNTVVAKTTILPIKTYALENTKTISAADVGFNKAFNASVPNLNGSSTAIKNQSFYSYDNMGLIKQQGKIGDIPQSYIWDYNNTLPIAVASNAAPEDIAYTSFEADGNGGWTITATDRNTATSFTGNRSYDLSKGNTIKTGLSSSKIYWISYWAKTGASVNVSNTAQIIQGPTKNGYTLWKNKINAATSVTISGSGVIDELRLYPEGSQMISYTYIPGVGINSKSDGGNIAFYEYDAMNRLYAIRDIDKNIIQQYSNNYINKSVKSDATIFKNKAISVVVQRSDCKYGYYSTKAIYTVSAQRYASIINQADADQQAQWDSTNYSTVYANANCNCITTFVRLSYENVTSDDPIFITGDVVLKFYKDQACTIADTVNNLNISYFKSSLCGIGSPTKTNYYITCNGSSFYIAKGALLWKMKESDLGDFPIIECSYSYGVNPANNYIPK